jgi:aldose 1-epimerase
MGRASIACQRAPIATTPHGTLTHTLPLHTPLHPSIPLLPLLSYPQSTEFGVLPDGRRVDQIRLTSPSGMELSLITYGATITSVKVPSKTTGPEEVTLCYPTLEELRTKSPYYGCTAGRVANRIAGGKFVVDGKEYTVATNNGPNSLHGGIVGFDKVVWTPRIFVDASSAGVEFTYLSKDGEEGYPGNLMASATYTLTDKNEVVMDFKATTDKATPVNMCNHTYWNLSGGLKENIHNHVLTLHCPGYLPVNSVQIPTGVVPVAGTPMDFTSPHRVGERIMEVDGGGQPGYDHCFARTLGTVPAGGLGLGLVAEVSEPTSSRRMLVFTDAPGTQLYTGNFLDGSAPHVRHQALCLETENYPDAVNQTAKGFPDPILRPGQTYTHKAVHRFEW